MSSQGSEDLAVVRPSVYLRIPGFEVLHLKLCCAALEMLLESLGQMLKPTLSFLFWGKT